MESGRALKSLNTVCYQAVAKGPCKKGSLIIWGEGRLARKRLIPQKNRAPDRRPVLKESVRFYEPAVIVISMDKLYLTEEPLD